MSLGIYQPNDLSRTKLGKERDRRILCTIEEWGCMSVHQIQALYFSHIANPTQAYRKAHERLFKLFKRGKLKRWRDDEGYIYSLEPRRGRSEHRLGVNWVRTWFSSRLLDGEILHWKYEDDYGPYQPDGFVSIENKQWKSFKFYFVEYDRGFNAWDKMPKVNQVFEKEMYSGRWWAEKTDTFPPTIIITLSEQRKKNIEEIIVQENAHGLRFTIKTLDDIKREVLAYERF